MNPSANSSDIFLLTPELVKTPNKNAPVIFIIKVPKGNLDFDLLEIISPNLYLVKLPKAPPIPIKIYPNAIPPYEIFSSSLSSVFLLKNLETPFLATITPKYAKHSPNITEKLIYNIEEKYNP